MTARTVKTTLFATISATALALSLGGAARAGEAKHSPEATAARAEIKKMIGFVPAAFDAVPDNVLPGAWEEFKSLQVMTDTSIPCKYKEVISAAVASQLPSPALVYGHSQLAKAAGASQAELGDGVAIAAGARHWSTFFNGMQLDETKFRADIARTVDAIKKAMASHQAPPAPVNVVDAKTAIQDIKQTFGFVPEFVAKFPAQGLAGAWREMRDVEMAPSALPDKYKSLAGLAVSAQIPCRYCIIADTEFAKLGGATDAEIAEAVAIGGMTRHWAALMTGLGVDEAAYKRDMDRVAKGVAAQMKTAAQAEGGKKAATMTSTKP
jgi:AhpD family alkylhydroperoxidase